MSKLKAFQDAVAAAVKGIAYFGPDFDVLVELGPEIQNQVKNAVARLGFFVVVAAPALSPAASGDGKPRFRARCDVLVGEAPTLNRTGRNAWDGAEELTAGLHRAAQPVSPVPGKHGRWEVTAVRVADDQRVMAFDVVVETTLLLRGGKPAPAGT